MIGFHNFGGYERDTELAKALKEAKRDAVFLAAKGNIDGVKRALQRGRDVLRERYAKDYRTVVRARNTAVELKELFKDIRSGIETDLTPGQIVDLGDTLRDVSMFLPQYEKMLTLASNQISLYDQHCMKMLDAARKTA